MSETAILSAILVGFGLIITLVHNNFNRRLLTDKMRKELFTEFNARYDKLNDSLYKIVAECKSLEDIEKNSDLKNHLIDYFNLCAEEYYWFRRDRIDTIIWDAWSNGMNDWYNFPVIKEAWEAEIKQFGCNSYYIKNKNDFFKIK